MQDHKKRVDCKNRVHAVFFSSRPVMGSATIIVRQMTENTSEKLTFGTPKYCVTGVMNMPKQVRIMAQGKT